MLLFLQFLIRPTDVYTPPSSPPLRTRNDRNVFSRLTSNQAQGSALDKWVPSCTETRTDAVHFLHPHSSSPAICVVRLYRCIKCNAFGEQCRIESHFHTLFPPISVECCRKSRKLCWKGFKILKKSDQQNFAMLKILWENRLMLLYKLANRM